MKRHGGVVSEPDTQEQREKDIAYLRDQGFDVVEYHDGSYDVYASMVVPLKSRPSMVLHQK